MLLSSVTVFLLCRSDGKLLWLQGHSVSLSLWNFVMIHNKTFGYYSANTWMYFWAVFWYLLITGWIKCSHAPYTARSSKLYPDLTGLPQLAYSGFRGFWNQDIMFTQVNHMHWKRVSISFKNMPFVLTYLRFTVLYPWLLMPTSANRFAENLCFIQ